MFAAPFWYTVHPYDGPYGIQAILVSKSPRNMFTGVLAPACKGSFQIVRGVPRGVYQHHRKKPENLQKSLKPVVF